MNTTIIEAIQKSAAVPSMPQVVTRFLEVIQDPEFNYDKVAKVLSVDVGTVSDILRLANSALFGLSRKVTSLRQAVTLLGPRRTRSLVLGRFLVESMGSNMPGVVDASYFWRRSLVAAVISSRLASLAVPPQRDEAFLCGLLADVGLSVLAQAFPREYAPILQNYTPRGAEYMPEQEEQAVGTTHAEISAMVLTAWSLPEAMCVAVAGSHAVRPPARNESESMALVINAADRLARLLCALPIEDTCAAQCAQAAALVGLDLGRLGAILQDVESEVQELAAVLRIDVIPSTVYTKIAAAISETLGETCAPA